jgi:hypothetical protein
MHPAHAATWACWGEAVLRIGIGRSAETARSLLLRLEPGLWAHHADHATTAIVVGKAVAARRSFRRTLMLLPKHAPTMIALAEDAQAEGDHDRAETILARTETLTADPTHARDIALARLRRDPTDRSRRRLLRFRRASPDFPLSDDVLSPAREWRGSSQGVSRLLVWGEQGLGDQIFFARDLPRLVDHVGRVGAFVHPRLAGLFRRSFPTLDVTGDLPGPEDRRVADAEIAIGDLGAVLPFEESGSFLTPDPAAVRRARARTPRSDGPVVGLAWRGGALRDAAPVRSITADDLAPLLADGERRGVRWVSVQHGVTAEEREVLGRRHDVFFDDAVDPFGDMDGVAARISALDAVVSINNTVVHLAGALGVPTIVLLPRVATWLWGLGPRAGHGDERTPWYRNTRLLRQGPAGGWNPVVSRVLETIERLLNDASAGGRATG